MAKRESSCTVCLKYIKYEDSRSSGKYCSNTCQGIHVRQQSDCKVEGGQGTARTVKQYLLTKHDGRCSQCNLNEWQGKPLKVQLDHIDGNSDNNALENCRLLCPNCHSQTDTFSGRNKKNTKRNSYLRAYKAVNKQKR